MQYPSSPILKDWAEKLVQHYDKELFRGAVVPSAILFVEDTITGAPKETSTGKKRRSRGSTEKKAKPPFDIKVLHPAVAERLDADYMVIFYKIRAADMEPRKLQLELLDVLMRCKDGKSLNQPEKVMIPIARVAGVDYHTKQFPGVDVLAGELLKGTTKQTKLELAAPATPSAETTGEQPGAPEQPDQAAATPPDTPPGGETQSETAAAAGTPPADTWQPDQPYAGPSNVVQFRGGGHAHGATGTDGHTSA